MQWTLLFVIVGVLAFWLDRSLGVSIFRYFYNLGHQKPLAANEGRGFIFGRGAKWRCGFAFFITALFLVVFNLVIGLGLIMGLMAWVSSGLITFASFYLGQFLYRFRPHTDKVFSTIDDVATGKTPLGEVVKGVSTKIAERAYGLRTAGPANGQPATETNPKAIKEEVKNPVTDELPEIDPSEAIRRFTREGGE